MVDGHTVHITNFYPRSPCGERHDTYIVMEATKVISIHALLAESDLTTVLHWYHINNFYPRSPCGERLLTEINKLATGQISIHALLAESDPTAMLLTFLSFQFLSTLSLRRAT